MSATTVEPSAAEEAAAQLLALHRGPLDKEIVRLVAIAWLAGILEGIDRCRTIAKENGVL